MLKIRRPLGRLIFNMGIAIPGKTVFLIETAPWLISSQWHIYVSFKCVIIGSGNGLASVQHQAIIWSNVGLLLIGLLGTKFNDIWIMYCMQYGCHFLLASMCYSLIDTVRHTDVENLGYVHWLLGWFAIFWHQLSTAQISSHWLTRRPYQLKLNWNMSNYKCLHARKCYLSWKRFLFW